MSSRYFHTRIFRAFACGTALAVGLAFILGSTSSALAKEKEWHQPKPELSAVLVFGDSLSDTGRLFAAVQIPPAPFYWNGRSSNGPLWPEYFSPGVGLDYEPLDNFAWAGAHTGRTNVWEGALGFDLPGMLDQLEEYVTGLGRQQRADKKALYVVFGGSNDFVRILEGENPTVVVSQAVTNIVTIVSTLQSLEAENIVVINLPNIGRSPRVLALDATAPGTAGAVTALSVQFNTLLGDALEVLPCNVAQVDAFAAMNVWMDDPAAYGFTNVTQPGLLSGTNGDTYFFWDDFHPTTRVHALLAGTIAEAIHDASVKKHKIRICDPRLH